MMKVINIKCGTGLINFLGIHDKSETELSDEEAEEDVEDDDVNLIDVKGYV